MGDVVTLVEKAVEHVDREKAEKLAKKMKKGELDFNDLADQLAQMRKMGGMQGLLGMLPGIGKVKDQLAAAGLDDSVLKRQEAIISSMTKEERAEPDSSTARAGSASRQAPASKSPRSTRSARCSARCPT